MKHTDFPTPSCEFRRKREVLDNWMAGMSVFRLGRIVGSLLKTLLPKVLPHFPKEVSGKAWCLAGRQDCEGGSRNTFRMISTGSEHWLSDLFQILSEPFLPRRIQTLSFYVVSLSLSSSPTTRVCGILPFSLLILT